MHSIGIYEGKHKSMEIKSLPLEGKVPNEMRRMRCRMRSIRDLNIKVIKNNAVCDGYTSSVAFRASCLAAARSHSGENNTQLFSKTLVPLRYLKGKPLICVTKRKPTHKTVTFSPLRMTHRGMLERTMLDDYMCYN